MFRSSCIALMSEPSHLKGIHLHKKLIGNIPWPLLGIRPVGMAYVVDSLIPLAYSHGIRFFEVDRLTATSFRWADSVDLTAMFLMLPAYEKKDDVMSIVKILQRPLDVVAVRPELYEDAAALVTSGEVRFLALDGLFGDGIDDLKAFLKKDRTIGPVAHRMPINAGEPQSFLRPFSAGPCGLLTVTSDIGLETDLKHDFLLRLSTHLGIDPLLLVVQWLLQQGIAVPVPVSAPEQVTTVVQASMDKVHPTIAQSLQVYARMRRLGFL